GGGVGSHSQSLWITLQCGRNGVCGQRGWGGAPLRGLANHGFFGLCPGSSAGEGTPPRKVPARAWPLMHSPLQAISRLANRKTRRLHLPIAPARRKQLLRSGTAIAPLARRAERATLAGKHARAPRGSTDLNAKIALM